MFSSEFSFFIGKIMFIKLNFTLYKLFGWLLTLQPYHHWCQVIMALYLLGVGTLSLEHRPFHCTKGLCWHYSNSHSCSLSYTLCREACKSFHKFWHYTYWRIGILGSDLMCMDLCRHMELQYKLDPWERIVRNYFERIHQCSHTSFQTVFDIGVVAWVFCI